MKISVLASLLATGSFLAVGAATPSSAQTYQTPFDSLGAIVAAPVVAAEDIAAVPVAATTGVVLPTVPVIQSNRTAAFIANVVPNIDFLDDASRMALARSPNPFIRRFAHRLAAQQTIAGNSITAWAQTNAPMLTGRSAYAGDPLLGLPALPINMIVGVGSAFTGGAIVASNGRPLLRSEAEDMARLSSLSGGAFDRLYRDTSLDALRQLATLYTDYAVNGDDPALRSFARIELPKVRMRIAELNRI
jgi:predicted outer membrane protein